MHLGRVVGTVVCTVKDPALTGQRLLVVQPLDAAGAQRGRATIALDSLGTGSGEMVYWCRGREASFPFLPAEVPTEATIVGIVDSLHITAPESSTKAPHNSLQAPEDPSTATRPR